RTHAHAFEPRSRCYRGRPRPSCPAARAGICAGEWWRACRLRTGSSSGRRSRRRAWGRASAGAAAEVVRGATSRRMVAQAARNRRVMDRRVAMVMQPARPEPSEMPDTPDPPAVYVQAQAEADADADANDDASDDADEGDARASVSEPLELSD